MILLLSLRPARRSAATTTVNSSGSVLHGMRPLNSLMLSSVRTRILPMKSRIFLISLEMEVAQSMNLTNSAGVLKLRKRSFRQLLRRLRLPLNKKRTRFCVPSLSLDRSDKRLIARSRRRKKSLTIQGKVFITGGLKYDKFYVSECSKLEC